MYKILGLCVCSKRKKKVSHLKCVNENKKKNYKKKSCLLHIFSYREVALVYHGIF